MGLKGFYTGKAMERDQIWPRVGISVHRILSGSP